jgi:hypothetical protein
MRDDQTVTPNVWLAREKSAGSFSIASREKRQCLCWDQKPLPIRLELLTPIQRGSYQ